MTRRALAALALLALAGCGSEPQPARTEGTVRELAMRFSDCMRDNGVTAFPDPDASGELTIDGIANGTSIDTGSAAFERAAAACKDLQPPGFTGRKRSTEQQDGALAFARCMRENGIEDFPDPTPDSPLIDTTRIPSAAGRGARDIPGFQAAIDRCRDLMADALAGQR